MRAHFVFETIDFERGKDPRSTINIGASQKYPDFYLFKDIHEYCKISQYPEFDRVSKIRMNAKSPPGFQAYTKMYYFSGIGIYKKYDVRLTYRGITFTQDGMNSLDSSYVSYREGGIKSLDEWKDILKEDYKIMKFNLKDNLDYFKRAGLYPS